jgi:hypothetical protein
MLRVQTLAIEGSVIVCEYFFREFHSRGSYEYLSAWAAEVDRVGREGWKVLDSDRRPKQFGLWTVVLVRPAQEFCDRKAESDRSEDSEGHGSQ